MPSLRFLEIYPVKIKGEDAFCLRDPDGYVADPIFLTPHACFVALMLDGTHSPEGIREAFMRQFAGSSISAGEIESVIEALDEQLLLDSPRFGQHQGRIDGAFAASPVRDAFFAGRGYPREPKKLNAFLGGFFKDAKGPGALPQAPPGKEPASGLFVPHIDFYRGGWCYAHAYKALLERRAPKRVFLLGVAHAGSPAPFIFSRKNFSTPHGVLAIDEGSLFLLEERLGSKFFEHEILHRSEHSLEFQAVWLASLYRDKERPKIIPVLCSLFGNGKLPATPLQLQEIEQAIAVFQDIAAQPETLVLASVDLAHVGPRFGDEEPLGPAMAARTQTQDKISLEAVKNGDAEGFWRSVIEDGNKRKICGLSAIYTALRLLGKRKGHVLAYGQALDPAGGIVSFASAIF